MMTVAAKLDLDGDEEGDKSHEGENAPEENKTETQ